MQCNHGLAAISGGDACTNMKGLVLIYKHHVLKYLAMKVDSVLLVAVGVVLLLVLLGLGVGVFMVFFGEENSTGQNVTLVKYQCYNGKVVSKLSECPGVSTTVAGVSSIISSGSCPVVTTCPRCDCITRPTTSPPTTLCIACTSKSTCGQTYSDIRCKDGVPSDVTYAPDCRNGCCIWTSTEVLKVECASGMMCKDGVCVPEPESED